MESKVAAGIGRNRWACHQRGWEMVLAGVMLALVTVAVSANGERIAGDHWLEVRLAGAPAGYQHEQVTAAADGGWRTRQESSLVLNRMESRVEIRSRSDQREDAKGHLLTVTAEAASSAETTRYSAEVVDGVFRLSTTAGKRSYVTETAIEQPLLGPQGARERSRQGLRRIGDQVEYRSFFSDYGTLVTVQREVTGRETLQQAGRSLDTLVVRETLDLMPVPSLLWLDASGRVVRQQQESPFGMIEVVRSDGDVRERVAKGAKLPEESYQNAVVRSNIRLPRPRSLEQVTVRIDLKRVDSVMPVLEGPGQELLEHGERHALVRIRRSDESPTGTPAESGDGSAWLSANPWLQSDHPDVRALAESLRRPGLGDYAQARVLQDWVTANMAFDAGIAMVPASEAVRDRRGTCVAYAVLLTTLARTLDIPARVVMGYVYVANMWGGHAWTEVLVDGHWIALDAAVWRAGPADAARIGVIRTSLEHGAASGLASMAQLFGNERIRVLDYRLDGVDRLVPVDATPFVVEGGHYRNDWLGITFDAPVGYAFTETEIMYPRSDVVVLGHPNGARITLAQRSLRPGEGEAPRALLHEHGSEAEPRPVRVAGRRAWLARNGDGSVRVVWQDDSDVWSLSGQGRDVEVAIRELLAGFRSPGAGGG